MKTLLRRLIDFMVGRREPVPDKELERRLIRLTNEYDVYRRQR